MRRWQFISDKIQDGYDLSEVFAGQPQVSRGEKIFFNFNQDQVSRKNDKWLSALPKMVSTVMYTKFT